jgi:hypothetical protein
MRGKKDLLRSTRALGGTSQDKIDQQERQKRPTKEAKETY